MNDDGFNKLKEVLVESGLPDDTAADIAMLMRLRHGDAIFTDSNLDRARHVASLLAQVLPEMKEAAKAIRRSIDDRPSGRGAQQ